MPDRRKVFFQNALLVVLGTLVGLGLVELLIRSTLDIYQCDPELGWTYSPGMTGFKVSRAGEFAHPVRFNALGLRDEEHRPGKAADAYRVLLLGDSFVGGLQVSREEAFSTLLTQRLTESQGRKVEVINAGVDGYGTAQQLLLFKEMAPQYHPDLTVLAVFLYTDLSDNSYRAGYQNHHLAYQCGRPYYKIGAEGLQRMESMHPGDMIQPPLLDRLLRWSTLYSIVSPSSYLAPVFQQREIFRKVYPEALVESWKLTQELILSLAAEVEQSGSKFVVMVIPHAIQVGQPLYSLNPRYFTAEQLEKSLLMMKQFLEENHLSYIDLVPAMQREISSGKTLYFEKDGHWNQDGHQLVADVMAAWLREHCGTVGLVPPGCSP